jgi:Concanavalin A-like lectin/glucanases superfamily
MPRNVTWICSHIICLAAVGTVVAGDEASGLRDSMLFFAGFDASFDAVNGADTAIQTAESTARKTVRPGNHSAVVTLAKGQGRFGDALRFSAVSKNVLFFDGSNVGYRRKNWSGSVSFWLKLDPDNGLAPGYCDPIQITDKTWNNSALWVDFDKELPRAFRLGVFPAFKTWNPSDTPWENFPVEHRPMVSVAKPPFAADRWTHVAITFHNINAADNGKATVVLYLDAVPQGTMTRPLKFDCVQENMAVMLGLSYIGDFDELAIFDRALTQQQIKILHQLPNGVGGL